jgi:isopenicillin-N epimerase
VCRHWLLDPSIDFLNHGSFGATPRAVLESQSRLRERIEARPVEMLGRRCGELLDDSKRVLGEFLGAAPQDIGFTANATAGINAVIRSLTFAGGDELLTTNHVYRAVRKTMQYLAGRAGAMVREVQIPLPVAGPQEIVNAIAGGLTGKTRLVVICHVTSPTAVVFPVAKIVTLCAERGVDVLIDGAHAAGVLDLNIESIGAAYYTGNLHKWLCAPKGSAFLWVRPDRQKGIHPNTISHFLDEGFANEFNWQGTRDISAWVGAKDSVEFMASLGWPRIKQHNHAMAIWVQAMLCQKWGVEPLTPLDGSMLGAMASVPLPDGVRRFGTVEALQAVLFNEHRFEVPVIDFDGRWLVRPCCQVYNTAGQYERLGKVVAELA